MCRTLRSTLLYSRSTRGHDIERRLNTARLREVSLYSPYSPRATSIPNTQFAALVDKNKVDLYTWSQSKQTGQKWDYVSLSPEVQSARERDYGVHTDSESPETTAAHQHLVLAVNTQKASRRGEGERLCSVCLSPKPRSRSENTTTRLN